MGAGSPQRGLVNFCGGMRFGNETQHRLLVDGPHDRLLGRLPCGRSFAAVPPILRPRRRRFAAAQHGCRASAAGRSITGCASQLHGRTHTRRTGAGTASRAPKRRTAWRNCRSWHSRRIPHWRAPRHASRDYADGGSRWDCPPTRRSDTWPRKWALMEQRACRADFFPRNTCCNANAI